MTTNYKRFAAVEDFSVKAATKLNSYVMFPFFKRGSINWIYSKEMGALEDLGIAMAAAISTGENLFGGDFKPLITAGRKNVIYMHKYMLTDSHADYMGTLIKSYTQKNELDKPYNGRVPFGMVQGCMFEFKMGFWKDPKESKEIQEAIAAYDVIIVDDYERLFGNKNMSFTEISKVLNDWKKAGKTIIILDQSAEGKNSMDKHAQKVKLADEVIKVTSTLRDHASDEDGFPDYKFTMHSVKANQAYPIIKFFMEVYEAPLEFLPSTPSVLTFEEVPV